MASNKKKTIVALKCDESGMINYHQYKPANLKEKLKVKKYSPTLKRHTMHTEVKHG